MGRSYENGKGKAFNVLFCLYMLVTTVSRCSLDVLGIKEDIEDLSLESKRNFEGLAKFSLRGWVHTGVSEAESAKKIGAQHEQQEVRSPRLGWRPAKIGNIFRDSDQLTSLLGCGVKGFLHPLVKDDIPLNTYHIDHLGPLTTSSKNYKFILAVIDSFTKFVWLYSTKTTSTSEVLKKLDIQKTTFGNPRFLITDRGTTFTSDEFHTYCSEQKITLHHITTGLSRANGQVERINRTIIPVLSKMSEDDPTKWFKHVPSLQEVLNSTFQRSINTTPFELLFGTQINNKTDLRIQQLIDEQLQLEFNENRELLRKSGKKRK
ncbi:hypothetical protein TNCV_1252731 [Trichonephila clavipes]|nr:hypothetical protein TNCV_1252731 [Trichonephila clavipes]